MSLSKLFKLAAFLWMSGCAEKQIPQFDGIIFSLDNMNMLLRYRYDQFTLPISDPNAKGAVCFLPDDFEAFMETYLGSCKEWEEDHKFITPRGFINSHDLKPRI